MINNEILTIWLFWIGACVGSFLNVVIYLLPRQLDFVLQRSHCPQCDKLIPFYQNIPLISYLWLRGKCQFCKGRISVRYFAIELVMAIATI